MEQCNAGEHESTTTNDPFLLSMEEYDLLQKARARRRDAILGDFQVTDCSCGFCTLARSLSGDSRQT